MKEDGTYTEIYKKWFKEDPPDSVFNTSPDESANNGQRRHLLSGPPTISEKGACGRPSYFSQTTPAHWRRSPLRAARFRPPSVTWMPASMPSAAL